MRNLQFTEPQSTAETSLYTHGSPPVCAIGILATSTCSVLCRADSIVSDAEALRSALLPGDGAGSQWSLLGQSFGGFCSLTYLSMAPAGVRSLSHARQRCMHSPS